MAQSEATASVRRSIEAVTKGLEVEAPDPHLVCHGRQLTRPHANAQAEEAVDADGAMDAQTRPQLLAKPRRRGFAQAPTAIIVFVIRRPERKDRREKSRFLRFYLASDTVTFNRYPRRARRVRSHGYARGPARIPSARGLTQQR